MEKEYIDKAIEFAKGQEEYYRSIQRSSYSANIMDDGRFAAYGEMVAFLEQLKAEMEALQLKKVTEEIVNPVFEFDHVYLRDLISRGKVEFHEKPSFGDLIPVDEFNGYLKSGVFAPSDGSGYYCAETKDGDVKESNWSVWKYSTPAWATHVMWYNK